MPKKTQYCIEGLADLRKNFPEISRQAHSVITFFLESLPFESIYCYALFCPEEERKILKLFMTRWHQIKPHLTGENLIEMGIKPGPQMKELLTGLRAACIDSGLRETEEAEWIKTRWSVISGQRSDE